MIIGKSFFRSLCFFGMSMALAVLPAIAAPIVSFTQDDSGGIAWYCIVEAEDMKLNGGWEVIRGNEGYFPAYPNSWSGNRLKAAVGAGPSVAEREIEIPASGDYVLWVRHESSYGFDAHFGVEIIQKGKTVFSADFGDRNDLKYFNGAWYVQGPWAYHNTDYVYSKASARLPAGRVTIRLHNGPDTKFSASRIVDLLCLTSDLEMEPGREMLGWRERSNQLTQPPIMSRCVRPAFFRLTVPRSAESPVRASLRYGLWEAPGGRGFGPQRIFAFSADGLKERFAWEKTEDEAIEELPAGFDSGWQRADLNKFAPAWIRASIGPSNETAVLSISHDPAGANAVKVDLSGELTREIIVGVGNSRLEDEMLRGKPASSFTDIFERFIKDLNAYRPRGRRSFQFGISAGAGINVDGFDRRELWQAFGASMVYFRCAPEYYSEENAKRIGLNRAMGYQNAHNAALTQACYEGDYERLEQRYRSIMNRLEEDGLGDIPQNIKMIEERGPPALRTLRGWKGINERFREYAKSCDLKPADLLGRAVLRDAIIAGKTKESDLWPLVMLGEGTPAEAADNPLLFYHTKMFGSLLFCDNLAEAVKLVEKIFPKGTLANAGAFWPQDGHAVRRNWYDEFMLFRRRGMTAWGSEITWGLCGMPHYVGSQTQSYEGTLARSVAKYHDAVLGPTHLLASGIYGYNADYVETVSYAMAAHGFTAFHFYDSTQYGAYNIDPDIREAVKRVSFTMGAIEDMQTESRVVPAKVALGWSETTAIWDQAEPTRMGFRMVGNVMYQLERHYLYILLRHLQLPVDMLCDADLEAGFLDDYDVYVMVGDHITAKAADSLRKWVESGGTLISVAGGGLRDEYSRPLDTLTDVYGIRGQRHYAEMQDKEYIPGAVYEPDPRDNVLDKREQTLRAKLELIHAHPLDEINVDGLEPALPVLGYKQGFKAEDGTVLGTFRNGQAAVVMNEFGEGRAMIMGFLPGIGYMYRAFPMVPYGRGGEDLSLYLYPDYKPDVRDGLSRLLKAVWPEMGAPVVCSNPYVEANLLKQKDGTYHVALVNFSGEPIRDLEVRVRTADVGGAEKVNAAFSRARVRTDDGGLMISLSLDKFEWLTLK